MGTNKTYFDSDYWDGILVLIQEYYNKNKTKKAGKKLEKQFEQYSNELGAILNDMANKIVKHKNLCAPEDLNDVVNECIYNCFNLLNKGKFNPKKGRSFSFLTCIIQNTAVWYHYKNNTDIPFTTFQEKSFIEESDENLIMYLAEYYERCNFKPSDSVDPKTGKRVKSKNVLKKKELRLMPFYRVIETDFESEIIREMETKTIWAVFNSMAEIFRKDPNYTKYDVIIVEAILDFLEAETKIERLTIRRIKKFVVNSLQQKIKERRWKFEGKSIDQIKRSHLITFVNKIFEIKVKPFLKKDDVVKEVILKNL